MKHGIFKSLTLATLASGALVAALPHQAEARVVVNLNTGPVIAQPQPCQGYTRTFIDGYGYQRTASGVACLAPNGQWLVQSEQLDPMPYARYPHRAIYRDAPSYYVEPEIVYLNDRNIHWQGRNDYHDNHGRGHH